MTENVFVAKHWTINSIVAISAAAWSLSAAQSMTDTVEQPWLMVASHTWRFHDFNGFCTIWFKKCLRSWCKSADAVSFCTMSGYTQEKRTHVYIQKWIFSPHYLKQLPHFIQLNIPDFSFLYYFKGNQPSIFSIFQLKKILR